jgi:hypothetical protein
MQRSFYAQPVHKDEDAEEVANILKKAVIQPGFDQKPPSEVALKSKTRLKKERRVGLLAITHCLE